MVSALLYLLTLKNQHVKKYFVWLFILSGLGSLAQNIVPTPKVVQAFSSAEIARMQPSDLARMNFRGEKLCWFENVKPSQHAQTHQLLKRDGKKASLSSEDLKSFNPLLYQLPQSRISCENLLIETTDGEKKLLIVRSEEMMQREWERSIKSKN